MFESNDAKKVVIAVLLFISILAICLMLGALIAKGVIAQDCVDYGKTLIYGKWYECKLK